MLILLPQCLGNLEEILCRRDPHNDPVHMPSLPVSNEGIASLLKRSNTGCSLIHIIQATSLYSPRFILSYSNPSRKDLGWGGLLRVFAFILIVQNSGKWGTHNSGRGSLEFTGESDIPFLLVSTSCFTGAFCALKLVYFQNVQMLTLSITSLSYSRLINIYFQKSKNCYSSSTEGYYQNQLNVIFSSAI